MSDNKKDNNINDGIIGFILLIVVLAFWYLSWIYIDSQVVSDVKSLSDYEVHGLFGDKFWEVNALFSAFAFAGIIFMILLQKREFFERAVKDLKYRSTCEYFKFSDLTKLESKEELNR